MIVRLAQHSDREAIRSLLPDFLKTLQPFGSLARESEANVAALDRIVSAGVDRHDPIVVAEADGEIQGFCIWTELPQTLEQIRRVLNALGTYVIPVARRGGVADLIRSVAEGVARDLGYECIVGTVHPSNVAGMGSLEGHDWHVLFHTVMKEL